MLAPRCSVCEYACNETGDALEGKKMKRFDDRQVCFHTGKKISPPMIGRKLCACCGLRIVKGYIVEIGHVGEDCADLIQRRKSDKAMFLSTVAQFVDKYKRQTGWNIKPSVRKTLETYYA